jgi:hypothetical protein
MNETEHHAQPITAVGVVIPVEWDDSGAPRSFALSTYGEEEFVIDPQTGQGRRLMNLVHRKVRVTGTLKTVAGNRRIITIKRFAIL